MEVAQAGSVGLGTSSVAELHFRILLGSFDQEGLVAEGVSEDDVAIFGLDQLNSGIIASLRLGDLSLLNHLDAHLLASFLSGIDEVLVVGGLLGVQEDEANLQAGSINNCLSTLGSLGALGSVSTPCQRRSRALLIIIPQLGSP